jgi:hypothetical protein
MPDAYRGPRRPLQPEDNGDLACGDIRCLRTSAIMQSGCGAQHRGAVLNDTQSSPLVPWTPSPAVDSAAV